MSLVADRPLANEALFHNQLPYEPQPAEPDISISGLWRTYTEKCGSNSDELTETIGVVPEVVARILKEHDADARSEAGKDGDAVFSLLDPDTMLPIVAGVTSEAVAVWEKALSRHNQPSLIRQHPNGNKAGEGPQASKEQRLVHLLDKKTLIVETAAAVLTVLPAWSDEPSKLSLGGQKRLAKVLANWGPQFLTEWMDGTVLDKWFRQQNLTDEEIKGWQDTITPGIRRSLVVHNINNPLAALDRVKANLELMTDAAIAALLGCTRVEARALITPRLRRHFAVNNINDPMSAIGAFVARTKDSDKSETMVQSDLTEISDFFKISDLRVGISDGFRYFIEVHYVDPDDLPPELNYLYDYVGCDHPYVRVFKDGEEDSLGEGILMTTFKKGTGACIAFYNEEGEETSTLLLVPQSFHDISSTITSTSR